MHAKWGPNGNLEQKEKKKKNYSMYLNSERNPPSPLPMRISRLQISSWFCIIYFLLWSWFCIQLFSGELILYINDIHVLILTNTIVDASWNGRSVSRHSCVLVNDNEPIVQIKSGIGTTLGTYFHTYLVAANESFLTLLRRDDDVSSVRPSVRPSVVQ